MPSAVALPLPVRARLLRHEVRIALAERRPRRVARAAAGFLAPRRWPPSGAVRAAVLREEVARGSVAAARAVLAETAGDPAATRPGRPAAALRADALVLAARDLPEPRRAVERTVAAYLRGELGPPPGPPAPDPAEAAARATDRAADLRAAGHPHPVIAATFPGFLANPYSALMERAYAAHGMAAVHVDAPDAVTAVVAGAAAAGYRPVAHLNAPDRFVGSAATEAEARAVAEEALGLVDRWLGDGATLVATIHNGPRLTGPRGIAEQRVAQGILDRAHLVHVLTATTPDVLAGWVAVDPRRTVHVPHPSYDGAYPPLPARDEARRGLGLGAAGAVPGDPARSSDAAGEPVVVGLLGSLADRKGGLLLLHALARVPEPLPDGRPLRLVVAGILSGRSSEELIRAAMADARVVARFGYVADADVPTLLAALDVAVVPYGQYLNSGWLHLALTAGVPVIAPLEGTATEIVRPTALRTFAANDEASLAAALAGAGELATDAARRAARESVADLEPDRLSRRFVAAVVAAVDGAPTGGSA